MKTSDLVWAGIIGVLLGLAIQVGFAVLFVFMFIWNISDIQNVGPNFWNIAWIAVAGLGSLGILSSFFKK